MSGYYILSSDISGEQTSSLVFAKMIFKAHRKAMKDRGCTSRLRYVGLGMSVYALTYPIPSASRTEPTSLSIGCQRSFNFLDEQDDNFELLEIESEEAYAFDFIKTLQKITYR
jgi:hypothetical protein